MSHIFYGHENSSKVAAINNIYPHIHTPAELYDALAKIWCEYSCTPRLRHLWSPDNLTLGQCSITAFLAQDIFGGKVLGILRPEGNYHCYNKAQGCIFDLTSEQFAPEIINYSTNYIEQSRNVHFARPDKLQRYQYLKEQLAKCSRSTI